MSESATHYRIQVNTKSDFTGKEKWNSGKVAFDSPVNEDAWSEDISYGGSAFVLGQKYWWRVKLWDSEGKEGDWSEEEAHFEMEEQEVFGGYIG